MNVLVIAKGVGGESSKSLMVRALGGYSNVETVESYYEALHLLSTSKGKDVSHVVMETSRTVHWRGYLLEFWNMHRHGRKIIVVPSSVGEKEYVRDVKGVYYVELSADDAANRAALEVLILASEPKSKVADAA